MRKRLFLRLLVSTFLICCYLISYNSLLQLRGKTSRAAQSSSGIWNLPPIVLLAIAGEFKGMVAAYLTLEAGAQLGVKVVRRSEGGLEVVKENYDWPAIHRIFISSQLLDPSFAQTFIVAQGWLPWPPANMVVETQEILQVAARNRPWDWQPAHAMGFNAYYFLNQPGEAGKLFLEAAQVPEAPPFLAILGARLAQKGGETETAIIVMKSILASKTPDEPGYGSIENRLKALEGVQFIENAKTNYERKLGQKPQSINELILSGALSAMPPNPYNLEYCMDSKGVVYFDKPDCRNADDLQKRQGY